MHVVQTERIRFLLSDRNRLRWFRFPRHPGVLIHEPVVFSLILREIPQRICPGPAGIFPLRLGRQVILAAFFFTEPFAELDTVPPADVQDRFVVLLHVLRLAPGMRRSPGGDRPAAFVRLPIQQATLGFRLVTTLLGKLSELGDGDFGRAQIERLRDSHAMRWQFDLPAGQHALIPLAFGRAFCCRTQLRFGAAHHELSRRNQRQLHADGVRFDDGRVVLFCPVFL